MGTLRVEPVSNLDFVEVLPRDVAPAGNIFLPGEVSTLSSLVSTYLGRAAHIYPSVFETWLLEETEPLLEFFDTAEKPAFAAVEAHRLQELRKTLGSNSNEYYAYSTGFRQMLNELVHDQPNLNIAVLTYDADVPQPDPMYVVAAQFEDDDDDVEARQSQAPLPNRPSPQQPIGAISSCFTTEEVCKNSTNTCSGHGSCVKASKAGRSCFVCACSASAKGEGSQKETTYWAGQSCERKDISSYVIAFSPLRPHPHGAD